MVVAAGARFTVLRYGDKDGVFHGLSEPSKYSSRWTVYVCPKCKTETGFEWCDFEKHVGSGFSNLMYQDRQAVEREAASKLTDENGFVDFYCPGCNGVVRAYYRYEPPEERVHEEWLELRIVVERTPTIVKPN